MTRTLLCLLGLLGLMAPTAAPAQDYPTKPITLVVNSEAGGPTDLVARVIKDDLSAALGQPVIVENRLGAGGVTGAATVARAAPDGYTLLMSGSGPMVLAPLLYTNVPYDPQAAFQTVNLCVDVPVVMAVSATLGVSSLKDFIALAKAKPGQVTYGTAGIGTPAHLGSELFKKLAGIDMLFIPYKGSPAALLALSSGELGMHISTPAVAQPHVETGKVKLLTVTGSKRIASAPDVPTVAEAGMPELAVPAWFALFAPKGTPQPIIDKLDMATRKALANPKAREVLEKASFNVIAGSAADFSTFFRKEHERWGAFIKEAGIKVQ